MTDHVGGQIAAAGGIKADDDRFDVFVFGGFTQNVAERGCSQNGTVSVSAEEGVARLNDADGGDISDDGRLFRYFRLCRRRVVRRQAI